MAEQRPRSFRRQWFRVLMGIFLSGVIAIIAWALWRYHGPASPVEIFRGVTYGCQRLPDGPDTGGLMHWVRADLNVPGVSLFTTPTDPQSEQSGFEYKLAYTSRVVADNHLAVAVNGALFTSASEWTYLPGDLAVSSETVVSDHQVNHVDPNSYLLWWDDRNVAHLEQKPPPAKALSEARWGIGSQLPATMQRIHYSGLKTDSRTAIGVDPDRKLVWLVCFDKASDHSIIQCLADLGAKFGVEVDGGTSIAMVIGKDAKNVRPGTITGNWRPVATHFGFRAEALP